MNVENILIKEKLLSLRVPGGSPATEFYFPDQPDLRHSILMNVTFYNVSTGMKLTYENNIIINDNVFFNSFLTLYDLAGYKFVDSVPLIQFVPFINSAANVWGQIYKNQRVNWTKSFIHIADNNLIAKDDEYYLLSVKYQTIEAIKDQVKRNQARDDKEFIRRRNKD